MNWDNDHTFKKFAAVLWPEVFKLADSWNRNTKGRAAARRVMAERHRGFRASVELAKLAGETAELQRVLARKVGAS